MGKEKLRARERGKGKRQGKGARKNLGKSIKPSIWIKTHKLNL
jgi:hypothetical protein